MPKIHALKGDITCINVDAIINAANGRLLGGGGVDAAIHKAAGPRLLEACRRIPEISTGLRCPTGEARITPAFDLGAKVVIHTVGPVFQAHPDPASSLKSCYQECLKLAVKYRHRTVAFPAISCGVYGYPLDEAAQIAVGVCRQDWDLEEIVFVLFEQDAYNTWMATINDKAQVPKAVTGIDGPPTDNSLDAILEQLR